MERKHKISRRRHTSSIQSSSKRAEQQNTLAVTVEKDISNHSNIAKPQRFPSRCRLPLPFAVFRCRSFVVRRSPFGASELRSFVVVRSFGASLLFGASELRSFVVVRRSELRSFVPLLCGCLVAWWLGGLVAWLLCCLTDRKFLLWCPTTTFEGDVIVACELRVVWLRSWLLHHPTLQRVQIPWASCAHILNEERKYVSSLNRKLCDTFVLVFCCQQPRFVGIVTFWSNQLVRTS